MPDINFRLIAPEIFLTLWAFVLMFVDLFIWRRRDDKQGLVWLAGLGFLATGALVLLAGQGSTFTVILPSMPV